MAIGRKTGGRKAGTPNRATIFTEADEDKAVETIRWVMEHGRPDLKLKAAQEVLDRNLGKPKQAVEHSGKDGGPVEVRFLDRPTRSA
jgi:hypothetical protein